MVNRAKHTLPWKLLRMVHAAPYTLDLQNQLSHFSSLHFPFLCPQRREVGCNLLQIMWHRAHKSGREKRTSTKAWNLGLGKFRKEGDRKWQEPCQKLKEKDSGISLRQNVRSSIIRAGWKTFNSEWKIQWHKEIYQGNLWEQLRNQFFFSKESPQMKKNPCSAPVQLLHVG